MDNIVCRICLKDDSMCEDIYVETKHKKLSYSAMMSALFSIPVSHGDGLPSKLCKNCRIKLISAYNLRLLAEKSYNTLLRNAANELENNSFKEENTIEPISKVAIKNELDGEVLGDSIIKQEYMEVVFDVLGSNKDEGVDDHLEDDRSLGYEDEDDTPLNLLHSDFEDTKENIAVKKLRKKPRSKIGDKKKKKKSSVCEVCGAYVVNLSEHSQTHLKNRKKCVCPHCPKEFNTRNGRNRHINTIHLGKRFYCELCNKHVKRLSSHKHGMHREKPFKPKKPKSKLENHIASHIKDVPPAFCDICGKMYKTKRQCTIHKRRVHDKEKRHACTLCSKTFFSTSHLKNHMISHTKERAYKCTECGKSFMKPFTLLMHKKRHTGIKDFNCTLCSSQFYDSGALKTHMISHTKEKKHPCRYCNVMFGRTDHRNKHEKSAHLNKLDTQLHKKNIDSIPDKQS